MRLIVHRHRPRRSGAAAPAVPAPEHRQHGGPEDGGDDARRSPAESSSPCPVTRRAGSVTASPGRRAARRTGRPPPTRASPRSTGHRPGEWAGTSAARPVGYSSPRTTRSPVGCRVTRRVDHRTTSPVPPPLPVVRPIRRGDDDVTGGEDRPLLAGRCPRDGDDDPRTEVEPPVAYLARQEIDPHHPGDPGRRRPSRHVGGRAVLDHPAAVDEDEGVRQRTGVEGIVGDEHARGARSADVVAEQLSHDRPLGHVEGGHRLVEEEEARLGGQRPGQGHPLGLATGETADAMVRDLADTQPIEPVLRQGRRLRSRRTRVGGARRPRWPAHRGGGTGDAPGRPARTIAAPGAPAPRGAGRRGRGRRGRSAHR